MSTKDRDLKNNDLLKSCSHDTDSMVTGLRDGCKGPEEKTRISLIGIGPGSPDLLSRAACRAIAQAQIIFGAERMLKTAEDFLGAEEYAGKMTSTGYRKKEILAYLEAHPHIRRAAVLYSGSLTFYSGAATWKDFDSTRYDLVRIPGISSAEYLLTKYGLSLKDVELLSAHGQECRPEGLIEHRRYVLMILGNDNVFNRTCRNLLGVESADRNENTGGIRVVLAENLSYPDEKITEGTLEQMADAEHGNLSMALFINPDPNEEADGFAIEDDRFVRSTVPMTKEEIRCLSLSFMHLKRDSVFYDIGAGTGSVSIAAADYLTGGRVYAFEKEEDACTLMEENRRRFRAANMEIIPGMALEQLRRRRESLPVPDAAFIGGSSGELPDLVRFLVEWNPDIVLGINSVTLETSRDLLQISAVLGNEWNVVMREVQTVRCRKAGSSHLKLAGNPVMIATIRKKNEKEQI